MGNEIATTSQNMLMEPSASLVETCSKLAPRDLVQAEKNIRAVVLSSDEIAEMCIYCKPVGKNSAGLQSFATGVSVRFAEIGQQCWGDLWVNGTSEIIDDRVEANVICFDLRTRNITPGRCSRSIVGKYGRFKESVVENTVAACFSIAKRNAIEQQMLPQLLSIMPDIKKRVIKKWSFDKEPTPANAWAQLLGDFSRRWGTTNNELTALTGDKAEADDKILLIVGVRNYLLDNPTKYKEVFGKEPAEFKKQEKATPQQEFQTIKHQLVAKGKAAVVNEIVGGIVDVTGNEEAAFTEDNFKECIKQMKEALKEDGGKKK